MKIFTSNIFDQRDNPVAVSIARNTPSFFIGRRVLKLAPSWDLINRWKLGEIDEELFELFYINEVLATLDPQTLAAELGDEAIICCWERAPKFCHRHIVARWLESGGIETEEI